MLCMLTVSTRDDAENLYLAIKMLHSTMGHADIETILDRYTHAQEERLCAVGQLLVGEFNPAIPVMNPDKVKRQQSLEITGLEACVFLSF